jgi:hypothetical protein
MRQLMGEQSPPFVRPRCEVTTIEHNVVPHGVGIGAHLSRRLLGGRAGMYPHPRKIVAETLAHVALQRWIKRSATAGKNTIYAGGSGASLSTRLPGVALNAWCCATDCGMRWSCYYQVGDPIRFLF